MRLLSRVMGKRLATTVLGGASLVVTASAA